MPGAADDLAGAKERGWRSLGAIDAAFTAGLIDVAEWHRRVLAVVEPAYLAGTTPQAQSGHSGDERRWERARRLLLDAVDRDGTFLDIGCANGLLMESVARWAAEDGHDVEPYGVEISSALAALARRRLPLWADRIVTADASSWRPARQFRFVRTGLEYVPEPARAAYVAHLLEHVVEPGGRLVVGVHNEEAAADVVVADLRAWGFGVAGRTTRPHRHPALSYKVCWIDA